MYENMTVLTNKEYTELVIKAHKYDQLREKAVNSSFISDYEVIIYEITEEEEEAIEERRKQRYETL